MMHARWLGRARRGVIVGALAITGLAYGGPQDRVEQARLMEAIRALPIARSPGPDDAHREGLRATEAMILARLREMGLTPTLHEFNWASPFRPKDDAKEAAEVPAVAYHNIVVDLPGTDKASEVVLVGAHFDAVPQAPGADDNGTGVAALLEMARAFVMERDAGAKTSRSVRVVFFNLEEEGCIGSSAYFKDWRKANPVEERGDGEKGDAEKREAHEEDGKGAGEARKPSSQLPASARGCEKIVAMLSLETMGYFSDEANSQKSPFPPNMELPGMGKIEMPTVGDFVAIVGIAKHREFIQALTREMKAAAPGLKTFDTGFAPMALPDMLRSDHRAFLLNGIPAVMVTDSANFRNPNYHKPTDTLETLDAARYTLLTKGLVAAVWSLAQPQSATATEKDKNDKWHE